MFSPATEARLAQDARRPAPAAPHPEDTAERIRAYARSVRPMGEPGDLADDPCYERGAGLVERIACSVPRSDPTGEPDLRLRPHQLADVLHFLRLSEPQDPRRWFDGQGAVGLLFVLLAVEESLRELPR